MSEASVREWFERYDALAAARDYAGMADLALFPLNEVTDDGKGNGSATQIDRAAYLKQMEQVMGGGGEVTFDTTRTPHFLSDDLVFVITDGTMTYDGTTQPIRYGDLLVKVAGDWKFQSMVQGGWG
ncbi:nuclear transport factor 2 family protein [Kribbella antibiotica]|uniref:Nuclear transport factor 2 family protein n=1 Tax=Kribbella antibiotica TaxID=190195 RepID=A0A4R4YWW9_9ACTN|nr:nuclear transport factor 2 family protein [Kribbella antibiotica]TDD49968.1 nuclear transport factor 2 family protein [Kribbella antibiotica]